MDFKTICTDIDGTLLNVERQLSSRTISAFRRVPSSLPVILASSRMPAAMRHLQHELAITHHPLICYNGGYVIHPTEGGSEEVLHSVQIPLEIVRGILELSKDTSVHNSLYFEDEWYIPRWDHWAEREATITKVEPTLDSAENVLSRWSARSNGAHKVMCMGSEHEIDRLERDLLSQFGNEIHVYRSRPTYLELAPSSISKGTALALLLNAKYSWTMNDVLSFGDNYNDIELLRLSGRGVAVANSREEVKAVADELTLDSKKDGVAVIIEKYF